MIPTLIFFYFLFGLWLAERYREKAQGNNSWSGYAATLIVWPAFLIMNAIVADISETDEGDDNDIEVT